MATWYHGAMVTWYHGVEMRTISARMLRGRFWLENQDFGVSFGAICIIFRATSFPTIPRTQNRLFQKNVPGVQGRRNGRGKKLFTLLGTKSEQGGHIHTDTRAYTHRPRMLRGRFWVENQDFGVSFGAICIIFRATSFPTSPGSQNRLFRKIAPGVQGSVCQCLSNASCWGWPVIPTPSRLLIPIPSFFSWGWLVIPTLIPTPKNRTIYAYSALYDY